VGFNHNVKHGQRVYHVQTEDSGAPHAHFITHLFLGGNIVATQKSSYADRAGMPDLAKIVRGMMEEQHKNMLRRLVAGEFREMSETLSAPHYEPGVLATGQTGPAAVNVAPTAAADLGARANRSGLRPAAQSAFAPSAAGTKVTPPKLAAVPVMAPAASAAAAPRHAAPATSAAAAPRHAAPPAPASSRHAASANAPAAAPRHAAAPPVSRTPAIARPEKAPEPIWEAAPPGASNPAGRRMPGAPLPQTTRVPPAAARSSVSPPRLAPSVSVPSIGGRASELLADPEASGAEQDGIPTLFAEELISEKSLDEVILAFLSADLEPHK
jgi:hypothetical protein